MVANLDYKGTEFPVSNISYHKTESKNNININVFGHQKKLKYPIDFKKLNWKAICGYCARK